MSLKKVFDVCVKTGTYQDRNGETKNRWLNVGAMLEGANGPFLLLERWFNPAGVETDRDSVLCSLFESGRGEGGDRSAPASKSSAPADLDDDIPF